MRRSLTSMVILSFSLALWSCSSNNDPIGTNESVSLQQGRWTFIYREGGLIGTIEYPPDGSRQEVEYTSRGEYWIYDNGVVKGNDSYSTITDRSTVLGDTTTIITYDRLMHQSIKLLTKDSLILCDEAADGFTWHFAASR